MMIRNFVWFICICDPVRNILIDARNEMIEPSPVDLLSAHASLAHSRDAAKAASSKEPQSTHTRAPIQITTTYKQADVEEEEGITHETLHHPVGPQESGHRSFAALNPKQERAQLSDPFYPHSPWGDRSRSLQVLAEWFQDA
jgi:hypothetical protein